MSPKPFVGSVRPWPWKKHGGIISQGAKCGQSWSTVEIWIPKTPTRQFQRMWIHGSIATRNSCFSSHSWRGHIEAYRLCECSELWRHSHLDVVNALVASWLVVVMRTPKPVSSGTLVYPLIWSYLSTVRNLIASMASYVKKNSHTQSLGQKSAVSTKLPNWSSSVLKATKRNTQTSCCRDSLWIKKQIENTLHPMDALFWSLIPSPTHCTKKQVATAENHPTTASNHHGWWVSTGWRTTPKRGPSRRNPTRDVWYDNRCIKLIHVANKMRVDTVCRYKYKHSFIHSIYAHAAYDCNTQGHIFSSQKPRYKSNVVFLTLKPSPKNKKQRCQWF